MITVEMPLKSLTLEIDTLEELSDADKDMEYRRLYIRGALDALRWIRDGQDKPSHNPGFPIYAVEQH